jgi:hypothetical protein
MSAALAALNNQNTAGATLRYLATLCDENGFVTVVPSIVSARMAKATDTYINAKKVEQNCVRLCAAGWMKWAAPGTHTYQLLIPASRAQA